MRRKIAVIYSNYLERHSHHSEFFLSCAPSLLCSFCANRYSSMPSISSSYVLTDLKFSENLTFALELHFENVIELLLTCFLLLFRMMNK